MLRHSWKTWCLQRANRSSICLASHMQHNLNRCRFTVSAESSNTKPESERSPDQKGVRKEKKTHTCCDVKSLTLCRIWLISDHILWVSVRHVILMLSVTYWTTEKSYFRPSNWQIKTKDQITKRRREEQLTKRFYRLYLSTICLQPVLKIRGEKLSAVQTYCALQNDASFG